ncbi:tautomerase family protein [Acerihabitans sp. TG2]|uniref:tautomerase family protein n=1 Tax=Acerihabitans sp. TG2 TaxID=3096008 RepID=UPI003A598B8D
MMPFTRIIFRQGRWDDELHRISDILHQALVDEFAVPPADRFQVIEALASMHLIYDPHYLTGRRSADYLLFHITAGKPRDGDQKRNFYRILTDRLVAALGISPDDIMIVMQFTSPEDWCFGNGTVFTLEAL